MKRTMIRALALVIALLLAALPLSVAEEIAVNNGQEPLAVVTENPSVTQELNKEPEAETGNNVIVTAMEPEIQESDEVDFSSEDLDDSDMTVYDESSDASNITDHALPFDQSVACGDVLINVTDGAGSFPEGATLQAEMITDDEIVQAVVTSLPLEGAYHHNLFHIVVMDATGNVILPNDSEEQPLIYLKGLDVSGDIKVALYDAVSGSAIEIQAQNREEGIGFVFVDSAVYDVMIQEKPEAQPVDGSTEDQPEGEPANEPVQSQSEDEPENEEPSEEPQRNPVDETSSDEQPLEQPTQDDRAANDSVQPEDQEREEPEESAECEEETENQSDKSEVEPEDKGEWINTTVEHLTDDDGGMDIELDDADAVEAAKLADPQYAAMALTYQYLPSILTVGDVIDLRQCLLFDNYNPSDVVSWKSSNTRVVKISKGGMLRALKTGKAKITVKTRDRKKRTISVSVRGNSIGGLFPKPTKGDAVALNGAFSIRPKSLKYSGTKLVAEFYLLNGYKKALYNIRGLSLNVFAGNRNNKIASQHFGRIKTRRSIKKGVSTFTVTFSGDGILQNNVHLMDYAANQIYFDLDVNAVYGKSGRKTVPFVATVIPNVPAPVLVSGIALNAGSLSLNVGESTQLTATVLPENAENKAYLWFSSDSNVASVDVNGVVKANAVGTATIKAMSLDAVSVDGKGVTASCTVTVIDPNGSSAVDYSEEVSKIKLQELSTGRELVKGGSIDYDISNGDPKIGATLITAMLAENTGKLRFIAYGMNEKPDYDRYYLADNKAGDYLYNGDISQSDILDCVINNKPLFSLDSLYINEYSYVKIVVGMYANESDAEPVAWTGFGLWPTDFGEPIDDEVKVTGVKLEEMDEDYINVGKEYQMEAIIKPSNATNRFVFWNSSNNDVASVDSKGKITAKRGGETTITVTTEDGGFTASVKCYVYYETPQNIKAVARGNSVAVSWNQVNGAEGYYISYGKTKNLTKCTEVYVEGGSSTSYTITDLYTDTTYYFNMYVDPDYCLVSPWVSAITENETVKVTGVKLLEMDEDYICIGDQYQKDKDVVIEPSNATNQAVTWTSSNSAVATIDSKGNITAKNVGDTTITVTTVDGGYTASINCSVYYDAPQNITAETNGNSVTVSWDRVNYAEGYYIEYAKAKSNPRYTEIYVEGGSKTSYTITDLYANTEYYFYMCADPQYGRVSHTISVTTGSKDNLSAPTGVAVTSDSSTSVIVKWNAATGMTGYKIYYNTTKTLANAQDANASKSDTNKQITGLTAGETYYFCVGAYNNYAEFMYSDWKACDLNGPISRLPAPSGVKVDATTDNAVSVSFNAVSGAAGYYMYYSTTGSFSTSYNSVPVDKNNRVGYADGLSSGKTYYFWIVAYDSNGTVGYESSRVSAITGEVLLTVRNGGTSGNTISNRQIIDWPIDQIFKAACSQAYGNGKCLVKSYVMSGQPSFNENDINKLVTGVAYQGTGYFYGRNGNDEFDQNTMSALPINPSGCSVGQYVKIWIAAEDSNYATNQYIDGIQFALRLTNVASCPVTGVSLNISSLTMEEGEYMTLIATVKPDNATNKGVTWSSSDTSVVTINNGIVRAIKDGTATITVRTKDNGLTKTCAIKVVKQQPIEEQLTPSELDLAFTKTSNWEQPYLKILSVELANAVYGEKKKDGSTEYIKPITRKFESLGIDIIDYLNIKSKEGEDTVGFAVGRKNIIIENEKITLYVVVVRGTDNTYNNYEWVSNFNIGASGNPKGFELAASDVALYLNKLDIDVRNSKIWFSGHSRGAAVANWLAGVWAKKVGFADEDVYAYTIACPNVVKDVSAQCRGVFNYNMAGDAVPMIPMEKGDTWGFKKFGNTRSISSGRLNRLKNMADGDTTSSLISILSKIDRQYYYSNIYPLVKNYFLNNKWDVVTEGGKLLLDILAGLTTNTKYRSIAIELSRWIIDVTGITPQTIAQGIEGKYFELLTFGYIKYDDAVTSLGDVFTSMGNAHLQQNYLYAVQHGYF